MLTIAEGLLTRSGMYQLLALGYAYPGSPEHSRTRPMALELAPWVAVLHADWQARLEQFVQLLDETGAGILEAEYARLFAGGMACSPHENSYERDIFRRQHTLADIAGFYRAFGFELPEASRWPPDHLGVQLEFCAIVLQRMAQASGDILPDQVEICADALRKFLADHLGRWAATFAGDLVRQSNAPAYQALAALTADWVELELAALGLQPERLQSPIPVPDDAEAPACGACTSCEPTAPEPPPV